MIIYETAEIGYIYETAEMGYPPNNYNLTGNYNVKLICSPTP